MFLADTDSDGISDFEEVNSGQDPLCPVGQSCSLLQLITPKTKLSEIIQNVSVDNDLTLEQAVAAEFRTFLSENGVADEELAKLSDQDLLLLFEAVQRSQIIPADQWEADTTPAQVREFLLSQPNADTAEINALTDQELLDIRDSILNQ